MRFRANIENVVTFQRLLQSIEKMQQRSIFKFTETEMHIICNAESEDGVQVWSQIKVEALFTEYRIQSNSDNIIALTLAPDALLQALRSAAPSTSSTSASASSASKSYAATTPSEVVMRLAKKRGQAVLALEIIFDSGGLSGGLGRIVVAHDVLVDVMRPADMEKVKEPLCPEPDIHILLPPLTKLRTVTEHLRQLAGDAPLAIHASRSGDLRLAVDTDDACVETTWSRCAIPAMGGDSQLPPTDGTQNEDELHSQDKSQRGGEVAASNDTQRDDDENDGEGEGEHMMVRRMEKGKDKDKARMHGVQLSVRAFLKFLSSHVISSTTIACICERFCMILYVYIGDAADAGGVLTFYIPARVAG